MKTQLPNGCSISTITATPKNWQAKSAKINTNWFISYRFYDPSHAKPKQVMIKGMNYFKTLPERQIETKRLLELEMKNLVEGFNPFIKEMDNHLSETDHATFLNALQLAANSITVATRTKRDLKYVLSQCEAAIPVLGYEQLLIKDVSRKHLKDLLNVISKTNDRYNKNRSYLMILFGELLEREIVNANFPRDLKKKKVLRQVRLILTQDERIKVNNYLKEAHKEFHRFLHIFFHSGSRISELLRMKIEDIDIVNQKFRIIILKGSQYKEEWKTIKNVSLPYWQELLIHGNNGQFVFSKGLKPGDVEIQPYQIGKRWYRLVKKKLNIKADFYSLKHLHTTEVAEKIGSVEAAKHNSHSSTDMVNKIYDITLKDRKQREIKTLNNPFA